MATLTGSRSTENPDMRRSKVSDQWLEMFSIFIHDLEPPLTAMKYILRLLREGKLDLQKQVHKDLVTSAQIAVKRAETIIFDIMAVARSGQIGIPVHLTELMPDEIIRESVMLVLGTATENDIKMTFSKPAGDVMVQADPDLLKRSLDNLLYNAIRHTPSGGGIDIYTSSEQENLFIHIKDSGPGLGDFDPAILFEKFGQMDLRSQGKHRGVGLGLYFCRLAATGMGGTIMADDHPDGGAVFSLKLKKAEVK